MWVVKLVKPPTTSVFPANYFPRVFRYRQDALDLQKIIEKRNGQTTLEKKK